MKKNISKKDIFTRKIKFPTEFLRLTYSNHALERVKERLIGEFRSIKPNVVKLTKNNIYSGVINENNELVEVKLKLKYNNTENMFLVLLLRDRYAIVKTIFLRDKKKRIQVEEISTKIQTDSFKEQKTISRKTTTEIRENKQETRILQNYMEQASTLFRNLWYTTWC